jgi:hypothetical protein
MEKAHTMNITTAVRRWASIVTRMVIVAAIAVLPLLGTTGAASAQGSDCKAISQEVYTYEWVGTGAVTFTTHNHTPNSCGDVAYGDTEDPACVGSFALGADCSIWQGPGWIGNGTATVNGWVNMKVVMPVSGLTEIIYCRTYYNANGSFSSWCST